MDANEQIYKLQEENAVLRARLLEIGKLADDLKFTASKLSDHWLTLDDVSETKPSVETLATVQELYDLAVSAYSAISIVFWRKDPKYCDSEHLTKAAKLVSLLNKAREHGK